MMTVIKELIEQIGGRERLGLAARCKGYESSVFYPSAEQIELMASALLAVLDAQQKPFMYAISDCDGKAHFDECCVSAHGCDLEDVVGSLNDFREGLDDGYSIVPVYAVPPEASVPDGWKLVPIEPTEEMNSAGWDAMNAHDAINPTYSAMLAAAPAPENKK